MNILQNIHVSTYNSLAVRAVQKDFQKVSFLITDIQFIEASKSPVPVYNFDKLYNFLLLKSFMVF